MSDLALTATSGTVTVPVGATSAIVRCIGPGGHGFNASSGAAGAYASSTISTTPGASLSYQTGAAGSGNDTWFVSAATVMAKAGPSATSFSAGGVAPAATSSVGTVRFKGGDGISNGATYGGRGGGGAAGPNGAGADGGTGGSISNFAGQGGGGANGGTVPTGTPTATVGTAGGNNRSGSGGGAAGASSGAAGASGTGGGGGGGSGGGVDSTVDANGGSGSQENIWVVSAVNYGPGGGGGGAAGPLGTPGNGGGYGAGGGASGRNQSPNAQSGLGTGGLIIIDWVYASAGISRSYATVLG